VVKDSFGNAMLIFRSELLQPVDPWFHPLRHTLTPHASSTASAAYFLRFSATSVMSSAGKPCW
jgi:hypothetical protein